MVHDITVRRNTEGKKFTEFGLEFTPQFIAVANTKKGVSFERNNGEPDAKLGKEMPRSIKGLRSYRNALEDPAFYFISVPKGGITVEFVNC